MKTQAEPDAGVGSGQNGWSERRDMHPRDIRLRFHGCRIHAREEGQEPLWESPPDADRVKEYPHRRILLQSVALAECEAIERAAARRGEPLKGGLES